MWYTTMGVTYSLEFVIRSNFYNFIKREMKSKDHKICLIHCKCCYHPKLIYRNISETLHIFIYLWYWSFVLLNIHRRYNVSWITMTWHHVCIHTWHLFVSRNDIIHVVVVWSRDDTVRYNTCSSSVIPRWYRSLGL